ncbi:DUF3817 domain-containing protein [Mucilaginibacter sabulilitoris]|uniref:DUF3817 domain-containing protein n=1 Tax=Mucilaginibacter sabulilitoris TaxID=1173583 RepID=A0ABZ0TJ32_9SPHI|nr:DUF3817 domain-containing protein [Mucilaginibacter sabulilitoris]WPU91729.1 DUF3817 domain-containing protein [Mucilaginibacter sabulilitoris]
MEMIFESALGRLRVSAYAAGVTLVLLLGAALPLKYFLGQPNMLWTISPFHVIFTLWFIFNTLNVAIEHRWKFRETTWKVLLSCVIPLGILYIDRHILKKESRPDHNVQNDQ